MKETNHSRSIKVIERMKKSMSRRPIHGRPTEMNMATKFDYAKATPADAHKIIAKLAEMLGVEDASDHEAIESALAALFTASGDRGTDGQDEETENVEDPKVVAGLTASERKACKALGCSYANFRRIKAGLADGAQQRRIARQDAAVAKLLKR